MDRAGANQRNTMRRWAIAVSILFPVVLAVVEMRYHYPKDSSLYVNISDPIFPLYMVYVEDRATYVLRCALMIPIGALLWRFSRHPLRCAGWILGAVTLVEILQFSLHIYYFRFYAVLVCAAGLALGAAFHAAVLWARKRKATQWAFLCACAAVAIGAEYVRSSGLSIYDVVADHVWNYENILILAVLLAKAICLSMAASGLTRTWTAAALCALLLCAGWPSEVWRCFALGGAYLLRPLLCALCAAGASALLCGAVFWQREESAAYE